MRDLGLVAFAFMVCPGCVAAAPEPAPSGVAVIYGPRAEAACRDYTAMATVDGQQQRVVGRICQEEDGRWHITDATPQQPAPDAVFEPTPTYSYYEPWLWGPPIGFGLGAVIVADGHRHPHQFENFHNFAFDGLRKRPEMASPRERPGLGLSERAEVSGLRARSGISSLRERPEMGRLHERAGLGGLRERSGIGNIREHLEIGRLHERAEAGGMREHSGTGVPRGRSGMGGMRGGFGRHG